MSATEIKALTTKIKQAAADYYAGNVSAPAKHRRVADSTYDSWIDRLRELDPTNALLKSVGAKVTRNKATLPHPMGSLDKVKEHGEGNENILSFTKRVPGPYIISDKLDGASVEIIYETGEPKAAYTRGDGTIGQDISHLIPHLDIPQKIRYRQYLAVRFEGIIPQKSFDKHLSSDFENARNTASGALNKIRGKHSAIEHMHFVAHKVLSPSVKPSQGLSFLKAQGFNVVRWTTVAKITEASAMKLLKARKASSHYEMDGLVLESDKKVPHAVGNPTNAVAFKEQSEIATTKVLGVTWEETRYGYLAPTVNIEPVRLAGVTVKTANGFNAKYILENKIGKGAVVTLMRSGEVIPDIQEVVKPAREAQMPKVEDFGKMTWTNNKKGERVNLVMSGGSELREAKRIAHFFTTIKAEGIKEATIKKLMSVGLTSILRIVKAPASKFMLAEGIQQKSAEKMRKNIDVALQKVTLAKLMDGSGLFGRNMGERRVSPIIKKYPNIMTDKLTERKLEEMARSVGGFDELAGQFAANFGKFKTFYDKLGIDVKPVVVKKTGSKLKNVAVCFTGVRDSALEATIESLGGSILSGVSSKTTHLIVKDVGSSSNKIKKARELGTHIMTIAQFKKTFGLP